MSTLIPVPSSEAQLASERVECHLFADFVLGEIESGTGCPEYRAWLFRAADRMIFPEVA